MSVMLGMALEHDHYMVVVALSQPPPQAGACHDKIPPLAASPAHATSSSSCTLWPSGLSSHYPRQHGQAGREEAVAGTSGTDMQNPGLYCDTVCVEHHQNGCTAHLLVDVHAHGGCAAGGEGVEARDPRVAAGWLGR